MDLFDSRTAHSPEASTDELASPLSPEPPPAACLAVPADELYRRFATAAEQEAYWIGVRVGAQAARAGLPSDRRHRPDELDFELTREAQAPGLVSTRLTGPGASPPSPVRALRHDGWTPEKEQIFLRALAATGVVADACRACGMSRDAAYSRRNRTAGRAFALAWKAALVLARPSLVDDVVSRARHGVVERIYRGGELVAERHRYDNRLTMAALTRLDRQVDGLAEREPAVQAVANEFEQFLDGLAGGNEAAEAFLSPRLGGTPIEPPHFRDAVYPVDSEPALLARAAFFERHGVGLPSDIVAEDLDPEQMESWTDDQFRRAEASGLLASLDGEEWPDSAFDGEADGTDGMCRIRKLFLAVRRTEAEDWEDE